MSKLRIALCGALLGMSACASPDGNANGKALATASIVMTSRPAATRPAPAVKRADPVAEVIVGQASWYGKRFHGRKTASGEPFDMTELTAAHRTLPFGTRVRVTNPDNGRSVVVRINDRGPFAGRRIIDLSRRAAETIGLKTKGVGRVKLEVFESA